MLSRTRLSALVLGGFTALVAGLASTPSHAHPHIWIDTGLELIHGSDGRIEAVRIKWTYDELFSLLLLEDLGLDSDYDGVLTEQETEELQGFDLDWPDDWDGDVYAEVAGVAVALGPPQAGPAALLDNGMLSSVHTRALERPIDGAAEELIVKVYDPTFYTSYTILPEQVSTASLDCTATVFAPDLDSAYAFLEAALLELGAQIDDPFDTIQFPSVGDRFAEEVRLTCAKSEDAG